MLPGATQHVVGRTASSQSPPLTFRTISGHDPGGHGVCVGVGVGDDVDVGVIVGVGVIVSVGVLVTVGQIPGQGVGVCVGVGVGSTAHV